MTPAAPPAPLPLKETPSGTAPRGRVERALSWLIRGRRHAASHLLLLPTSAWLAIFLLFPLALLVALSFAQRGPFGMLRWSPLTLDNYRRALAPAYLPVLLRTLGYAGTTTALCLALGYPVAYFLAFFAGPRKNLLLILLMLPFWTICLIGVYSWIILLGREGLVNGLLLALHLRERPVEFLNTPFSVILGLTYFYLPYMILPLYGTLEKIPRSYVEASKDLGAGPARTFAKVTFPLSLPGVAAGVILTFVPCLGDFFTAEFLGGPRTYLLGNLIQSQFLMAQDWPFGASLASIVLLFLISGVVLYERLGDQGEAELRTPA